MSDQEMSERLNELHLQFEDLRSELESTDHIDAKTVAALNQLLQDASQVSRRAQELKSGEVPVHHNEIMDRVREFDSEHPGISRFLTQMTDFLGMLGI
jgi:predicted nuclease with TOPRIM domain